MNELHVIHSWKDAELVRKHIIQTQKKTKIPVQKLDWYTVQDTIEWHDATHPEWKKKFTQHLTELKSYERMEPIILVLWNAQAMNELEWSLWKDVRSQIYTYFISDRFIPCARKFGMRVVSYPPPLMNTKNKELIVTYINRLLQKDWKAMIDLRNLWLSFLEWNRSFLPLQLELNEVCGDLLKKNNVSDRKQHIFYDKTLSVLSEVSTKVQCMMAAERTVIILLRIIEEENSSNVDPRSKTYIGTSTR